MRNIITLWRGYTTRWKLRCDVELIGCLNILICLLLRFKWNIFKILIMALVVFKKSCFHFYYFIIINFFNPVPLQINDKNWLIKLIYFSNAMLDTISAFRFRINDRILEINELNVKYMGEREFNEYLDKLSTISTIKLVSTKSLLLILVG